MTEFREIAITTTLAKTKSAVRVRLEDDTAVWLPWRVIENNGEELSIGGEPTRIYVAEWFAEQEGIE